MWLMISKAIHRICTPNFTKPNHKSVEGKTNRQKYLMEHKPATSIGAFSRQQNFSQGQSIFQKKREKLKIHGHTHTHKAVQ